MCFPQYLFLLLGCCDVASCFHAYCSISRDTRWSTIIYTMRRRVSSQFLSKSVPSRFYHALTRQAICALFHQVFAHRSIFYAMKRQECSYALILASFWSGVPIFSHSFIQGLYPASRGDLLEHFLQICCAAVFNAVLNPVFRKTWICWKFRLKCNPTRIIPNYLHFQSCQASNGISHSQILEDMYLGMISREDMYFGWYLVETSSGSRFWQRDQSHGNKL